MGEDSTMSRQHANRYRAGTQSAETRRDPACCIDEAFGALLGGVADHPAQLGIHRDQGAVGQALRGTDRGGFEQGTEPAFGLSQRRLGGVLRGHVPELGLER